jgi:hypothetical protein
MISAFIGRMTSRIYKLGLKQIKKSLKNCFSFSYKVVSAARKVPKNLNCTHPGSKYFVHLTSGYLRLYTSNPFYIRFFLRYNCEFMN